MRNPRNAAATAFVLLVWVTLLILLAGRFCEKVVPEFRPKTVDEMIDGNH
jgi:hypothetical protein